MTGQHATPPSWLRGCVGVHAPLRRRAAADSSSTAGRDWYCPPLQPGTKCSTHLPNAPCPCWLAGATAAFPDLHMAQPCLTLLAAEQPRPAPAVAVAGCEAAAGCMLSTCGAGYTTGRAYLWQVFSLQQLFQLQPSRSEQPCCHDLSCAPGHTADAEPRSVRLYRHMQNTFTFPCC